MSSVLRLIRCSTSHFLSMYSSGLVEMESFIQTMLFRWSVDGSAFVKHWKGWMWRACGAVACARSCFGRTGGISAVVVPRVTTPVHSDSGTQSTTMQRRDVPTCVQRAKLSHKEHHKE